MSQLRYTDRDLEPLVSSALKQFPAILITGPRQAGKSTFLQHSLKDFTYVSLDDATHRTMAREDPQLFLNTHGQPLIIDEIQYAPELLSYIKIRIDQQRQLKGQYVLTGSQIFQLMEGVTESLAGRVAIFHLYPFNWREAMQAAPLDPKDVRVCAEQIVHGFYPELFLPDITNRFRWYESYVMTYLERDVRNIRAIENLDLFQRFLGMLATRIGSQLNLSELARDCGISQPTARSWLSILRATYTIHLLQPYFRNRNKRLVKSPKLYFVDTGLACHLLGIDSGEQLLHSPERGHLFENMVVMEWIKRLSLLNVRSSLYFYRQSRGHEVDLLLEARGQLTAMEIKLAQQLNTRMTDPLHRFLKDHPNTPAYLLSMRPDSLALTHQVQALHWFDAFSLISYADRNGHADLLE